MAEPAPEELSQLILRQLTLSKAACKAAFTTFSSFSGCQAATGLEDLGCEVLPVSSSALCSSKSFEYACQIRIRRGSQEVAHGSGERNGVELSQSVGQRNF